MHSERQLLDVVAVSGNMDRTQVAAQTAAGSSRYTRSRQMVNALREEFLYSEKRVRDMIFRILEEKIGRGTNLTVSRLARELASAGREHAQDSGIEPTNWDVVSKAILNAMLGAGVLLDEEGRSIGFTIAAQATKVAHLVPDYADRTEAFLLKTLIRKLGDVTARDHTALAHALFRQFDRNVCMEALEDRVVTLLAGMADRIGLAKGGTYSVLD